MGKSTYVRTHVLDREPRFLCYDHMGEFFGSGNGTVVYSVADTIDFFSSHRSGVARCYLVSAHPSMEEFRLVCKVPFAFPGMTIILDELDQFAGPMFPPEEFTRLVHFGRHADAAVVGVARRPADLARAFTSQAQRFVVFRQTEPKDITYLRSILGPQVEKVKELPALEYLAFEGGHVFRGRVKP
jgi:hypothetical protein